MNNLIKINNKEIGQLYKGGQAMKHLKRLSAILGTFGSIAAIVCLTGATANNHISTLQFALGLAIVCVVMIGCILYIDKNMEGGEWID